MRQVRWLMLLLGLGMAAGPARGQAAPGALLTYRGRVVNGAGRGVSGASVLVKGTHTAVTTNADGIFLLPLPPGAYTLLVDYPGHLAMETLVQRPDSTLTIKLYSTQPRRR